MSAAECIVVVGGGILTVPLIERAAALGLETAVLDGDAQAPGMRLADHPLAVSTRDASAAARAAVELARTRRVTGVVTAGADVECTVAAIAEALGLPGVSPESAHLCNHKAAMRRVLAEAGLPGPRFAEVGSGEEARARADDVGFPMMVKPMDNCGSRGVVRVDAAGELVPAVDDALALSRSGSALLEEFVEGTTHTVEMLAYEGEYALCSVIDTHHGYPPWAVELDHVNPSRRSEEEQQRMLAVARHAAAAVGIRHGPAKVDFLFAKAGPVVMEMTARLSGGFHCQLTTPLALGTDNLRAAIDLCRGVPARREDVEPRWQRHAICRALFPQPGRVVSVRGVEEARKLPGIERVLCLAGEGDVVPEPRSSADRRFFVVGVGATPEERDRRVEAAVAAIRIETAPA